MIDVSGRKIRDTDQWRLVRRSAFLPFAHGAIMYRQEIFEKLAGYRDPCKYWEDQDLVWRAARLTKVAVIPRTLFRHRQWTSTRFVCDPGELEQAIDRVYQAADRLGEGTDLVRIPDAPRRNSQKVDPRVFLSMGSVQLWAAAHPRLFRRFLSQGNLRWNARTFAALAWTAWASASPASLRVFLRLLLKARNLAAASRIDGAKPMLWQPLKTAQAIDRTLP